jgi:hypothetical protein
VDHDKVAAVVETPKRVMTTRRWIAGGVYYHIDAVSCDQRFGILSDVRRTRSQGLCEGDGRICSSS